MPVFRFRTGFLSGGVETEKRWARESTGGSRPPGRGSHTKKARESVAHTAEVCMVDLEGPIHGIDFVSVDWLKSSRLDIDRISVQRTNELGNQDE